MSTRLKNLKLWERCTPAPVAATDNSFFIESGSVDNELLFITSNTTAYLYSADVDGWVTLPSPALAGTFGPGSCGKFHQKSFTINAGSGSGGDWHDPLNGGIPSVIIKTSLSILTDLRTSYITGGEAFQNQGRIIAGTGAGRTVIITGNSTGPNSEIYILDSTTFNTFTVDTTTVIEFYTGRYYVMNAGTVAAGSFKYFEVATQTWVNGSIGNLPGTWGTGGALESSHFYYFVQLGSGSCAVPPSTSTVITFNYMSANITVNALVGGELSCISGANAGQYRTISANNGAAVTVSSAFTNAPTDGDTFQYGAHHDNIYLIGNGAVAMYLYNIAADTWSVITPNVARAGAPGGSPSLSWVPHSYASNTDYVNSLKIYSFRGDSSNVLDVYDIPTKSWSVVPYGKQAENFNVNSSWIFDKTNIIYCQINPINATVPRFISYSVSGQSLEPFGVFPYTAGTPMNGKRMAIFRYALGSTVKNSWLYFMPPSSALLYRVELF